MNMRIPDTFWTYQPMKVAKYCCISRTHLSDEVDNCFKISSCNAYTTRKTNGAVYNRLCLSSCPKQWKHQKMEKVKKRGWFILSTLFWKIYWLEVVSFYIPVSSFWWGRGRDPTRAISTWKFPSFSFSTTDQPQAYGNRVNRARETGTIPWNRTLKRVETGPKAGPFRGWVRWEEQVRNRGFRWCLVNPGKPPDEYLYVHNMMHLYPLYPYIVYPILMSRFGSMDLIHIIHILLSATSLIYINLKKGLIKHWKTMCSDAWKLSDIFSAPNPLGKNSISFI